MLTIPPLIPLTIPEAEPTVATRGLLLVHAPPEVELVSVIDEPAQTVDGPEIAAGEAFTVMLLVAMHAPIV